MFLKHLHPYQINHLHDAISTEKLGEGGYGSVERYQCKEHHKCDLVDMVCDKCFIVKKFKGHTHKWDWLNRDYVYDKLDFKLLLREYSIGILLDHPNIRKTLDVDLESHCLIFENCPGIDFFEYLYKNKLHINKKKNLFYYGQLLNAIEYLHDNGISHMDLKLENIIIDESNDMIKLIDFGQAFVFKINNKIILEKSRSGTIQYTAPEVLNKNEYNGDKVDVWCCGIILYNLLYNKLPWYKANIREDISFTKHSIKIERNELDNGIFSNLYDFTKNESNIIMEIFKSTLAINPLKRGDIKKIKQLFSKLEILLKC